MTTGRPRENEATAAARNPVCAAGGPVSQPGGGGSDEQVLREILGVDVHRELIDFAGGAGGNPHLVAELARGLAEEGLIRERNGRAELVSRRIPRRVLSFVMRRLNDVSAGCQQFLKVAAALGRSFMLEDVSRMLGRSSAALLPPVDEAIASGFVVAAEHQLAFQSDFLLRGIIEAIPGPARDALRREAMSLSGRRSPVADRNRRMDAATAAPVSATGEDATGSCSRAHRLIMSGNAEAGVRVAEAVLAGPAASPAARRDAQACLVLADLLLGGEGADPLTEAILRERDAESGDAALAMALTARSTGLWSAGKLADGLELGRAAVRAGAEAEPVWRLHAQLALAGKLANLREFDEAEALINEAEAGLRGLPAPIWTAAPAVMRSRLLLQAGRIGDARREAALATAAVAGDAVPMLRPLAYAVLSTASFYMGDVPAAIEYLRRGQEDADRHVVLDSVQYSWAEVLITVKQEGPRAAARLLAGKHRRLPTRRRLYVEVPSAAAFLVLLARDVDDRDLERRVLATVDGLAADNPGIQVVSLTAMHAHALANSAPAALALIIVQSRDPISVALATEELAKLYAAQAQAGGRPVTPARAEETGVPPASCWSTLSDMEQRIAYLVSVGLTNRQIAKQVHLSAHTVNYHLRKVYRKLGFNTRAELAHAAATYSSRAAIYSMTGEPDWDTGSVTGKAS
ncbi:DNA-binding CsgD family transcriptional regulator [Micromonospora sp. H404/HB375]|nr:DNA-binding CsgD family transcriptional regulator [Micromonospora sp. H404/HB375]